MAVVNRDARVDVAAAEALGHVGDAVAVRVAQRHDAAFAARRRSLLPAAAQRDVHVAVVAHGDMARAVELVGENRRDEAVGDFDGRVHGR